MKEVWKDIVGYEGIYRINQRGGYSRKLKRGWGPTKTLGDQPKAPYKTLVLYKDGKSYSKMLHRVLAEAFIPNPENKPCVNHKDGNKKNNDLSNLEWCSVQYNSKHYFHELGGKERIPKGEEHHLSKFSDVIISNIFDDLDNGVDKGEVQIRYEISKSHLNLLIRGGRRQHLSTKLTYKNRPRFKLSAEDIIKIRRSKESNKKLAEGFKVTPQAIGYWRDKAIKSI